MNKKQFAQKWQNTPIDEMEEEVLREFKLDCFSMYEEIGFTEIFNSPYDDCRTHNGQKFQVIRRALEDEADLEAMPIWLIQFENGETAYCYPEEICKEETVN